MAKKKNGANFPDLNPMKNCIRAVEECLDRIATLRGEYMEQCKEVRAEIADIYTDAKQKGVNTQAVKTLVQTRILVTRIEEARAALDHDSEADYRIYADAVATWEATPLAKASRPTEQEAAAQ